MKPLSLTSVLLLSLVVSVSLADGQQNISKLSEGSNTRPSAENVSSASTTSLSERIELLRKKRANLSAYLETVDPGDRVYDATVNAIRELDVQVHALKAESGTVSNSFKNESQLPPPNFVLATPGNTHTNESLQPTLSWTRDLNTGPHPVVQEFIVQISDENSFNPIIHTASVKPRSPLLDTMYSVPEGVLQPGIRYYWRVLAVYLPTPTSPSTTIMAANAPTGFSFTTSRSIFKYLSDRGFALQKTVDGPDASKGAEFSFLRTIGKKTVYTEDFAVIYNHHLGQPTTQTSIGFQTSVEGKLTSDESESEDAWRFRVGAVIDHQLKPSTLNFIYLSLNGKFESSQDFTVKKMSFEAMFTPTLPDLLIGVSKPQNTASPVQFRWRPYLSVTAGRTLKVGTSQETKDTVFRLSPRVTGKLKLNFLNEILKLNEVYLWFDDTFYYLPLELKTRRNIFTSGFELQITDNLGFGLTYKNGESAPTFKRVNTLGGTVSVRFKKE